MNNKKMKIYYGLDNERRHDVSDLVKYYFMKDGYVRIPATDEYRNRFIGDPVYGQYKNIFIEYEDGRKETYDHRTDVNIIVNERLDVIDKRSHQHLHGLIDAVRGHERLNKLYNHTIFFGNQREKPQEQEMIVSFLPVDAKVLEIGAGHGSNSMLIASILEDDRNLVSVESDPVKVKELKHHRFVNGLNFHVVEAAMSKKRLAHDVPNGITRVMADDEKKNNREIELPLISPQEIKSQYSIKFDTLIIGINGNVYETLIEFPDILDGMRLVIIAYSDHRRDHVLLQKHNLRRVYVKASACEVWKHTDDFSETESEI